MELSRRVFSFLGLGIAATAAQAEPRKLRAVGDKFPVDIRQLPAVPAHEAPPVPNLGRNTGVAFGRDPIDAERLAEAVAMLRSIGFVTCSMDMTVRNDDYARIYIELGQARDPRVQA